MIKVFKNKSWKIWIFSLLAASIFWTFSRLGNNYNYRINYPIQFIYNEDSIVTIQELPEYVRLDVSGIGWDFFRQNLWFKTKPVKINLEDPASTKFLTHTSLLPIISAQLSQFEVNYLLHDTVFVHLDTRESKTVKLMIDSSKIDMESDHRIISSVVVSPDTARIYGPKSFIDTLDNDYVIVLPSKEISRSYNRFVGLALPPNINGCRFKPSTVNVTFQVGRFAMVELAIKVEQENFPDNASISLEDEVVLQFTTRHDYRNQFSRADFEVIADYSQINLTDSTLPLNLLSYPEEAIEMHITPDTLKVIYE